MIKNMYADTYEADRYISEMLPSINDERMTWDTLDSYSKEAHLMHATAKIDALPFKGRKAGGAKQVLAFPREGQCEVPETVKQACAIEACALFYAYEREQAVSRYRAQGVTAYSLGTISETFLERNPTGLAAFYSPQARYLLRPYLRGVAKLV